MAAAKKKDDDDGEPLLPPSPTPLPSPSQGEEDEVERRRRRKGGCKLPKPPTSFLLRGEGVSEIGEQRAISPGESAPKAHAEGGEGWISSFFFSGFFLVSFSKSFFDCNPCNSKN